MLAQTDNRMVIGVCGSQRSEDSVRELVPVVVQVLIVLLIYGLQFSMESTQDNVLEAVRLYLCPVLQLVTGDVLHINRLVVAGEGITAVAAYVSHYLIILVGDEVSAGLVADAVYLVIDSLTLLRVGCGAVYLVQVSDLVQQDLLLLVVGGTQIGATLEHHVLQVMCQTGSLCRLMLAAGMYGYKSLDAWLLLVNCHVNLQAVRQGVHFCVQWVVLYGLVIILLLTTRKTDDGHNG